ncbi:free fatty acid receptor 2-like [Carettochelys insculpta]|uniref:free fatty acid receptor 2-like n=1 Tax=Carettochelys insculpta TaxID=44489 RepID=UPI003EB72F5C
MGVNLGLLEAGSPVSGAKKMHFNIFTPLLLTVYVFTFVTGFLSNLLAFYTFLVKVRQKPAPVDILLLNLTVSDLLFLIFFPFKMVEAASAMEWNLPRFLCPFTSFIYYSSIYISSLFLMAVSVERYLGVAFPIKYKVWRRPAYATASMFFWLVAFCHCSIFYVVQYQSPSVTVPANNESYCYDCFSPMLLRVQLEFFIVLFCLPFTITVFCYVNFIRILVALPNITACRKWWAVGLVLVTLFNFIICFAPYNLSHAVGFVQNESPDWRVCALLLTTLNASLDPVVFYFSSTAIQQAFAKCRAGIRHKLSTLMARCYVPCVEGDNKLEAAHGSKNEEAMNSLPR